MALDELRGRLLGTQRAVIERGPVRAFARAVMDDDPIYDGDGAPVPPTFPFALPYWGSAGPPGALALPVESLRGPGRVLLHGEQEFIYHGRWPRVGDVLAGDTVVSEVREQSRSGGDRLEFYVVETAWRDEQVGDLVVTSRFTLVVNVRPPHE